MVSKRVDIEARKDRILEITIDRYINTVTPVSSAFIAEEVLSDLSSATIRNILAELEEEGYLTHPHTSAGRIPTQKGYRYYVDHLMHEIKHLAAQKNVLKWEHAHQSRELEHLLEEMSQEISKTTHYTSIISVDGWGNKIFCKGTNFVVNYPDYQDIAKVNGILLALEQKERLLEIINKVLERKIEIFIGQELAFSDINSCSLVVSSYKGKEQNVSGRLAVLGPTRMDYSKVVSTLDYYADLIQEIL